jgi:uncharacterized protein (DUF488 family)
LNLWTIGFTKTSAERFFGQLMLSGAVRVVDVRLNNVSQLSGFAKRNDLAYFLRTICDMDYLHMPNLAPTAEMLGAYRKQEMTWDEYERQFLELMHERDIETSTPRDSIAGSVLLCSEDKPVQCHRRLVAEYLAQRWGDIDIRHLI